VRGIFGAEEKMQTETFLQTVLGDEGHYCLTAIKDGKVKQQFYSTIVDLVSSAADFDRRGGDAYFALATFNESGSRKADNVKMLRSFFIDLDCGPTKEYPSQKEALTALQVFCKSQSMPKPTIVNSGRGIHAYWPLSEPVTFSQWEPAANKFKQLCLSNGLKIDPVVTADAARILRVPGTHNHKDATPKRVSLLGTTGRPVSFQDFCLKVGTDSIPVSMFPLANLPMASHDSSLLNLLAGNSQNKFKLIIDKTVKGKGCAQIAEIVKNQSELSEPMWRAGLSIAKFCEDSEKAIHFISRNHTDYDAEDTERKAQMIKGPYLCTKFDEFNPGVCGDCQHKGNIKSPIVLGKEIVEADVEDNAIKVQDITIAPSQEDSDVIPSYPKPYFRGKNGGVYIRTVNADGDPEERLIYHNDLYVIRRIKDPEFGESLIVRLHLPQDGISEFLLPLTAATSREEFRKAMSMKGVAVLKMDDLMAYVTSWVNDLQGRYTADDARRQFGWADEMEKFILGDVEYRHTGKGVNYPSSSTADYFPAFKPKGTLGGWVSAIDFYNRPGLEFHQLAICAGFGSVLMEFLPNIDAAGLHIYSSESGFGKTTLLFAVASIWGKYKDLVIAAKDTGNFSMNRAEIYKSLPFCIDEVTSLEPKALSEFAMGITDGRQKGRMSSGSNAERYRGDSWSLLALTTANTSMIERISAFKNIPQAEAQRILEKRVSRFKFEGKFETDDFNREISNNYGHAGPVFIKYVLRHRMEVESLIESVQRRIDKKYNLSHENRFWSAYCAVSITGCIIANKCKLVKFNPAGLLKEVGKLINENRSGLQAINKKTSDVLNEYINENWNNILKLKSTDDLRKLGGNNNGLDDLVVPTAQPRIQLIARYETDTKIISLLPKPLKEWCVKQHINHTALVDDMVAGMGAVRKKVRLGKGTNLNLPPTDAIVLDCKRFDGLLENVDAADDDTA
jgi:hypothetical protein